MASSIQKQRVLVASLTLSGLLAGAAVGGLAALRYAQSRLEDPEFLAAQLAQLETENDKANDAPRALVRLSTARSKSIQPTRPFVGRLVEIQKVTVCAEVTGNVVELPVEEGTPVSGGETLLARIDEVWSELSLAQREAQVASAQARLDYEEAELDRLQRIVDRNVITQSELQARQSKVDELRAALEEARVAAREEQERRRRSRILAPFDGTVVAKHVELGGHVAPGTPIVEIVSRGQVDALLMIPESVVNRVAVGQDLAVHVDPLGEDVPGKVVSVTPYGPGASRTFPVRVRLDDQDGRLKAGMSVTAVIATGPMREALVVSSDAVLVRPDGSTVWVAAVDERGEAATVLPVPVAITVRAEEEYAVQSETAEGRSLLRPGASVVIEGAERLTPRQQVGVVRLAPGLSSEVAQPDADREPPRPGAVPSLPAPAGGQEG